MKIIDHVTKKQIGEMENVPFKVNDRFKIQTSNGVLRFLVTGVDTGEITVFELTKEQWEKGYKIKDVLI